MTHLLAGLQLPHDVSYHLATPQSSSQPLTLLIREMTSISHSPIKEVKEVSVSQGGSGWGSPAGDVAFHFDSDSEGC